MNRIEEQTGLEALMKRHRKNCDKLEIGLKLEIRIRFGSWLYIIIKCKYYVMVIISLFYEFRRDF